MHRTRSASPVAAALALSVSACAWSQTKLVPADVAAYDVAGLSVSVSGNLAIIGSPYDDDKGSGSGSATIFRFNGTAWIQEVKLLAADGAAYDSFGSAVGISGDRVAVAARYDDDGGVNSGSVYIFHFDGSDWVPEAKLHAGDAAPFDDFGCSLSIDGDRILVGARNDADKGFDSGSAYLFHRSGSAWTQEAKLTASDGTAFDRFGSSVSIRGGVAAVGAPIDDPSGWGSGSAYVFRLGGSVWSQEAKLKANDFSSSDEFGHSVAVDGNVIAIGAWGDDDAGWDAGAAYVFRFTGGVWSQDQKLVPNDGAAGDYFGSGVAIRGNNVLVGSPLCDATGPASGAAYRFRWSGSNWTQQQKLTAASNDPIYGFGYSVSIDVSAYLVGTPYDDDHGTESGCAQVFTILDSLFGDLNGDGVVDQFDMAILLGAWADLGGPADLDEDGIVGASDLALILGAWTS